MTNHHREAWPLRFLALMSVCLFGAAERAYGAPQAKIVDLKHYSQVFGEERNIRVFLPPDYDRAKNKRYPVVYFFHGWGQRYNDWGTEIPNGDVGSGYGGDNVSAFVGTHDLIVVRWDGYNPRTPGEAYPRPYNIGPVETNRQFPLYFPELVAYIDNHFRTVADREDRATSGLSMGGFMSFWIAGKYPHLVGSASNFMGSSEFDVGPKEFPVTYRHTEAYRNYEGVRTRIVLGSRDFIRWYHRRMNAIWDYTRPYHESAEFDSTHGTPGMAKTLAFHMEAFRNPLPRPARWHHVDVYPDFEVWGYKVSTNRREPGYTILENVSSAGFRSSVRSWLPDGSLLPATTVRIVTSPVYRRGGAYTITDVAVGSKAVSHRQNADSEGRLHFVLSGARHDVGIHETGKAVLTVAGWNVAGAPWAIAGKPVQLQLSILNKGAHAANGITAVLSSRGPDIAITQKTFSIQRLASGTQAAGAVRFIVADPSREVVAFKLRLTATDAAATEVPVEVPFRRDVARIVDFRVMDGSELPLWRKAIHKAVEKLGSGNADGVANPGERIAIAVPDGDAYRAVELFTSDPCVDNSKRILDDWAEYDHVGEAAKISLPLIQPNCPDGHEIPFFLRYWRPNAPEHSLLEGMVYVRVARVSQRSPR